MNELSIHDQIDQTLTALHKLTHGKQRKGYMDRIRTVETSLRRLCELARVQKKKKPWFKRLLEWKYIFWG